MKKLNTKGFSHVEMLIALVVVLAVGGIGFYTFNSIKDRSSQAETVEKATPEQMAFTPAEKAAADAEPEASASNIFSNRGGVYLRACRTKPPGWNDWAVSTSGYKNTGAARTIITINVNRNRVIDKEDLKRTDYRFSAARYGQTKSGYIKFLIGQTGAYKVLKFNSLAVC